MKNRKKLHLSQEIEDIHAQRELKRDETSSGSRNNHKCKETVISHNMRDQNTAILDDVVEQSFGASVAGQVSRFINEGNPNTQPMNNVDETRSGPVAKVA